MDYRHSGFDPSPWLRGGHRQTLAGYVARRRVRWERPSEDMIVAPEPDVLLLARASWQPGPRHAHPALLMLHGLGGSDASSYALSSGHLAYRLGWHVVRMNLRGAGDSVAHCARLYNAGLARDVVAVATAVAAHASRVDMLGFSLGGNLALLALARHEADLPGSVSAAVAVCPPIDLSACADALARPSNRGYQWYFMRNLRQAYRERRRHRPDLFAAGIEDAPRTIRDWDEVITAPHAGYSGAAEYYARSSAGPDLVHVRRPALILAAADDPLVPVDSVTRWPLPDAAHVVREVVPTGGHVGFVAPSPAPGRFWAAARALEFLSSVSMPGA